MAMLLPCSICKGVFNHTSLCEYKQGKLLIHLTIPFEEKPENNNQGENLRYYRVRSQLTTRQLAEKLNIVPATLLAYEQSRIPIPHDVAIKAAEYLSIDKNLLFDGFATFLATPYTVALKAIRDGLKMNQRKFAEHIGILPSYYYKLEAGNRRPSRRIYEKIIQACLTGNRQTSQMSVHSIK